MSKPITVLTGLDYWLDNLMCNVPELAMCFHLDGIVKVWRPVVMKYTCSTHGQELISRIRSSIEMHITA